MKYRPGCGACCIAPSISGPIPGMPLRLATCDGHVRRIPHIEVLLWLARLDEATAPQR
ncbi:MAG: hypothetical protein Q8K22_05840 [Rhodoferax sp.]|nr:hypothetical protein [Rhodoferax sp.]